MQSATAESPSASRPDMARRVAEFDWASTSLGPRELWPYSLKTAVGICLCSSLPMFVWWGAELINIHNDAYAAVLGKRHADALGRPAREIWANIWDSIEEDVRGVIVEGRPILKERVRFILERNGFPEETFFTYSHSPILDDDGRIAGLFQVCIEETARVNAERERDAMERQREAALASAQQANEAMRQSNALLKGISDSTTDAIFAKDRQGRMLFANPATLKALGKTLDQVLGKTELEMMPERAQAARALMENDRIVMETGREMDVEETLPTADGGVSIWLSHKTPHRDADGNVIGLLGTARDITEKQRDAERIARLYEVTSRLSEAVTPEDVARVTVHQGIAAVGATAGSLALLSEKSDRLELVEWMGYSPDAIQKWAHIPLNDEIPISAAFCRGEAIYLSTPQERARQFPGIVPLSAIKGTRSSACMPLMIAGRPVGTLGLSFDRPNAFRPEDRALLESLVNQCAQALERARLFERERAARADAERASRMKDEFLATLSHELRTPLNAILGWATILSRGRIEPEELSEGLRIIERNARSQTQMIEDLLDMSRIISDRVRLELHRTDLVGVVRAAADSMRPAADAKGVALRVNTDLAAAAIGADPGRLQQVFWNLLSNAVKFTPRGGEIEVTVKSLPGEYEVSVADTGEGIAPEFLPRVFDRFRQADASTTRRYGGLGLGLAIVKQLVELHDGTVRVSSEGVGKGATFTVLLPSTAAKALAPDLADPLAAGANGSGADRADGAAFRREFPRLEGSRVLIVDDEHDARTVLRRALEECKAVVFVAESATEALSILGRERLDVLISDIGMPNTDGYSLIQRVRALSADAGGQIPAIALTAYARGEDRQRALRAGFQEHMAKPVQPLELLAAVARLHRSPQDAAPANG
jgi:PAS domain S-box-containing protein